MKPIKMVSLLIALLSVFSTLQPAWTVKATNASLMQGGGKKVYLPVVANVKVVSPGTDDRYWATVAGNSARTSWTPQQAQGDISSGTAKILWYRPIQAYIPQNVQIIASYGMLYISSAKGLYALNATTGAVRWRFDTELPLGNSPSVANGVVYVGGYDRKIYALNAMSGTLLWKFKGALAGFNTNPLVVNGKVILGNRDGYMYAVGAYGTPESGKLVWKYRAGGSILLSAAYKDGKVFFAANDNYAYALNVNTGALVWKSKKLPGDGFQSYWPVIFRNPVTGKDLVVFSVASGYRTASNPGRNPVSWKELFASLFPNSSTLGPQVNLSDSWAKGKTVVDYSRASEYYENNPALSSTNHKPWQREYVLLNAQDGSEYTYDSDGDGYQEYAPVFSFATNSGNNYPPVAASNGLLYFSNLYENNGQGRVMGWRVGTPYMAITTNQGDTAEPQAISGGGSLIYRSICCDRVGDWINSSSGATGMLWHYGYPLYDSAPGYDSMWWLLTDQLSRLYGNYGNVNGIYHNHGDQNPIVPYQGKMFIHRSNAIIAFGTGQAYGKLPTLAINPVKDADQTLTTTQVKWLLESEIQKIISAGHLRPGYYNAGQFNDSYPQLLDYFDNPGDTLYTLSRAYPHLSAGLQQAVKTYLQAEYSKYFDPIAYSHTGWVEGTAREAFPLPPEIAASLKDYPKIEAAGSDWAWRYPQYNLYAMWKYAEKVAPENALKIYTIAKSKLEVPVSDMATNDYFIRRPWEHNGYIAGYIGFLKLQELAGRKTADAGLRTAVTNELNRLLLLRVSDFSKDTYYKTHEGYTLRTLNVSRNFIMLVPELGDYLNKNALLKLQGAIGEYESVGPYWFVSRFNSSVAESATQNLYDYPALFQAKAYILKQPRSELVKYLDVPAFARGDLFYIQNAVTALEAP